MHHSQTGYSHCAAVLSLLLLALVAGCEGRDRAKAPKTQNEALNWHGLCDKWRERGYDALSEPEKVWLNTRAFIDSTENGGLISFFYNSYADHYQDTLFALGQLQASHPRQLLEDVGALFGDEVPSTMTARNEIIDGWASDGPESNACKHVDEALTPLLNSLEQKLESYLIEHGFDPDGGL